MLMKKKQSTIIDVAMKAGVSKATVGRVIGNYGNVSEDSRNKVLAAIEELNYIPNAIAQGLRASGTKTIGVVVGSIKNNFCNQLLYSVEKVAINRGYDVLFCNTGEKPQREFEYLKNLKARRVDGIILISSVVDAEEIPHQYKNLYTDVPIVLADRKICGMDMDFITSSNYDGAYNAVKRFASLGHKHVGIISYGSVSTILDRIDGYRHACQECGIMLDMRYMLTAPTLEEVSIEKIVDYIQRVPEMTAVIVLNNSILPRVITATKRVSRKLPDDLSVVTWDDDELNELFAIDTVVQQR